MAAAKLAGTFAQIVREGVSDGGGALVELRGDEALAVFSSPRQALVAAVALQTRFAEHSEAAPEMPLGVGIGLDVGEAVAVCDPAVDGQIREAARGQATGLVSANLLWAKLDRELVDRAVLAPLLSERAAVVVSRRVGNYQFNPQWGPLLDQMWVR